LIGMLPIGDLNPNSQAPLYRQVYEQIRGLISSGQLEDGFRLPATRELAGQLGLNRTTISSAYELLEHEGLITGHVGRGSFVAGSASAKRSQPNQPGLNWSTLLDPAESSPSPGVATISFSASRPSEHLFPIAEFRASCSEVINGPDVQTILQLGSPAGYAPLRRYLLEQARAEGAARDSDDILITSGCQQAFDLLQRTLAANNETVLVEDPVYPGARNAFQRGHARVIGVRVGAEGIDLSALETALIAERPRLMVVTPTFQNPTGATMPPLARENLLRLARRAGTVVIENDIYGTLAYQGGTPATLKQLDERGDTILLRSFSKLAFPGLRVGWVIGPRPFIQKLTEAKQWSDLHSDQLSQAVLLRFAESGRLEHHHQHVLQTGGERLQAALDACHRHLPAGTTWTHPRGGMNLWVRLPQPLDAGELAPRAEREGVSYLPGKYFAVGKAEPGALRLSFAGLSPSEIETGIAALGRMFTAELERVRAASPMEATALV
jgi:2-aminoadipate transaminase